jgi:hypothetical protein
MNSKLSKEKAAGMTVNERLFVAGLMDDFDRAEDRRDVLALRSILQKIYLDPASIEANIRQILAGTDAADK